MAWVALLNNEFLKCNFYDFIDTRDMCVNNKTITKVSI